MNLGTVLMSAKKATRYDIEDFMGVDDDSWMSLLAYSVLYIALSCFKLLAISNTDGLEYAVNTNTLATLTHSQHLWLRLRKE